MCEPVRSTLRGASCAVALCLALVLAGCDDQSEADLLASATQLIEKKDTAGATVELKRLLQAHPGSARGRYLYGKLLHGSGDMVSAEVELQRALEAGQAPSDVFPLLAGAMVAQGKHQAVLGQFRSGDLPDGQAQAELMVQVAAAAAAIGSLHEAAAALDEAEPRATDRTVIEIQRARLSALGGDRPAALARVQAVLARQPDHPRALALLGNLLAAGPSDQLDAALAAWRRSLAGRPDDVAVHASIVTALMQKQDWAGAGGQWKSMKAVAPAHMQTLYLEALLAEQRGDLARTRELVPHLLRRAPESLSVLMLAGRTDLKAGQLAQAETRLRKAVQLAPDGVVPRQMLAQVYLRTGQPDKALDAVKPLMEARSPGVEAMLIAAQAHLVRGETEQADALYARAAKLHPDHPRVRTAALIVQLAKAGPASKGDAAKVLKELEDVAAADPGTAADFALIQAAFKQGRADAADRAIERYAAKAPEDPMADALRARVALLRKDVPAARGHFERALSRDGDFMPALMGLTTLDLLEHKPADARARLEKVVARNRKHVGAMVALSELNERTGGTAQDTRRWLRTAIAAVPDDPLPRHKLIDHLLRANDLNGASEEAQASVAALPDDGGVLDRLGLVQMRKGEVLQATTTFQKMTGLQPASPLPWIRLAGAQTAARDLKGAAASLREARQRAPDDAGVHRAMVALALAEGKPAVALAAARKLQARDRAAGLVVEGDIEAQQKNWPAAASAYRKALLVAPVTEVAMSLHDALRAGGQATEASQFAAGWTRSHPDDLAFIMLVARAAMASGRLAEAEGLYRAVLSRRPEHVMALNNLAAMLAAQGKRDCLPIAEKAIALSPEAAALQDTLAACLASTQQLPRAIEVQRRAVELEPRAPQYALQLARLYLKSGEKEKAISELEKLEQLGGRFQRQPEVKAMLRAARG